ncbi:MAG: NAD(P)H-dependent amine dehydrogenase family protein [Planctomycetota bacterium]
MAIRVVQWATGAMGKTCLRAILDHPDLELVGLYVYSDGKVGRDAGEIARREPVGVVATDQIEEILALDADVVVHAPRLQPPYAHHNADIQRLLASGKNVISINGHTRPSHWGAGYAKAFEDACRAGNSTLLGAGLNPGFVSERLAAVATGLCNRIDHVHVTESVDARELRSPDYVFRILGFGAELGTIDPNDPNWAPAEMLNGLYSEVVADFVDRMGLVLDRIETDHVMLPATRDIEMAAGRIPKGTVGHTNWRWHGLVDGARFFSMSIHWVMENTHLGGPDYPLWRVEISGQPGVDIAVNLKRPHGDPFKTSAEQWALAACVVNAIPDVCAAPAGLMAPRMASPFRARFGS